jgi:hypothetical protein
MAKHESLSKLHPGATEERVSANAPDLKTSDESAKTPQGVNLPRGFFAPARPHQPVGKFKTTARESQACAPPEILSRCAAAGAMDRSAAFAALAARDAMMALAKRFGRRGLDRWRRGEGGWPVIQA